MIKALRIASFSENVRRHSAKISIMTAESEAILRQCTHSLTLQGI